MPAFLRTIRNALGRLSEHRFRQRPSEPRPSQEELWIGHVAGPAARFQIDDHGHEFVIEREALALELRKQLVEHGSDMRHELHQVMTDWSDARYGQSGLIADLPYRWRSFSATAIDLIERGQGHCLCRTCQRVFPATEMKVTRSRAGQEYVTHSTQVLCPVRHVLIQSEAHFRMRVPRLPARPAESFVTRRGDGIPDPPDPRQTCIRPRR